jgi:hypothetical protein
MFNIATICLVFLLAFTNPAELPAPVITGDFTEDIHFLAEEYCKSIYCDAGLEGKLDYEIYRRAFKGITELEAPKKDILTIIDYSKPACDERFYVIDLVNHKLLYKTLVAHGKNSGELYCTRFSNRPNSLQSSPGFFLTGESYAGRHGYSMRLDGMEPGINDKARARAIVIHGAEYVAQHYVNDFGYIGRSFGCPALPVGVNKKIIDLIKGGSCLYIHSNDKNYVNLTSFCCD